MATYAAQFETAVHQMEAWQRISSTKLKKKIIKTWTRVYKGIPSKSDADSLLEQEIMLYNNIREGAASLGEGGMWTVTLNFKTAEWFSPEQVIDG